MIVSVIPSLRYSLSGSLPAFEGEHSNGIRELGRSRHMDARTSGISTGSSSPPESPQVCEQGRGVRIAPASLLFQAASDDGVEFRSYLRIYERRQMGASLDRHVKRDYCASRNAWRPVANW